MTSFDVSGEPAHTRCLNVALTRGPDGSIEFRADILDLRKTGLMELAGRIAGAGIIHKMEVRGAFSAETDRIERIDWDQSHVMHEANRATRGECCRDPMVRLRGLVGVRLGAGFAPELKQCFGGPLGCTHVNTLLQELGALVARLRVLEAEGYPVAALSTPAERIASRSVFFDACFPEDRSTAEISVRLTDRLHTETGPDGSERLFAHDEVRLVATVELSSWQLRSIRAGERLRRGPSFVDAPWQSREDSLGGFSGRSLGGGMARYCLEHLGERKEDALLLSALLSLAPGMTQVGVAASDLLAPSSASRPGGLAPAGPGPCYMLRTGGPLMETIFSGRSRSDAGPKS